MCDEEENATFVFDTQRLAGAGIDDDTLQGWTKDEIKNFLADNPGAGYRLVHSELFTEKIISLLEAIPTRNEAVRIDADSGKFLDHKRRYGIGKEFNVSEHAVRSAVSSLENELGDVETDNRGRPLYSADQRAIIHTWLKNEYQNNAKEGERAVYGIARNLSVGDSTVLEAIQGLGEELGPVKRAKVGTNRPIVYTPAQQASIRAWLVQNGKMASDEGRLPLREMATLSGLSEPTIRTIAANRAEELGKVDRFGLTIPQQEALLDILDREGYLAPKAPEGYATDTQLPVQLGYSKSAIDKAVAATKEQIGGPGNFMVGAKNPRRGKAYSPQQQEALTTWLQANGYSPTRRGLGAVATNPDTVNMPGQKNE
ncbi:MAG TPA: hypothetical protein VGO07_00165 [Candidatus Saccharimonadales bacterium]|nr:hypothetical protein [Candidatus Saccharimonadales bacterium]